MKEDFPEFAWGILRGLGIAVQEDQTVFLLALTALTWRTGLGKALALYIILRRADDHVGFLGSNLARIANTMDVDRV